MVQVLAPENSACHLPLHGSWPIQVDKCKYLGQHKYLHKYLQVLTDYIHIYTVNGPDDDISYMQNNGMGVMLKENRWKMKEKSLAQDVELSF